MEQTTVLHSSIAISSKCVQLAIGYMWLSHCVMVWGVTQRDFLFRSSDVSSLSDN